MKFPQRLIDGYHAFTATRLPLERSRFQKLAETGQQPEVMVICCCDSRVSPEVIFDSHPGELFVVRNIANLVPLYSPSELRGVSAASNSRFKTSTSNTSLLWDIRTAEACEHLWSIGIGPIRATSSTIGCP
jgi:Carbonic anhydrase